LQKSKKNISRYCNIAASSVCSSILTSINAFITKAQCRRLTFVGIERKETVMKRTDSLTSGTHDHRQTEWPAAFLLALVMMTFTITGCFQATSLEQTSDSDSASSSTLDSEDTDTSIDNPTATITLNGTSIAVSGDGATVSGTTVTITKGGRYLVTGSLSAGQLVVNDTTDSDTVKVILDNAAITCTTSAPMYVETAEKIVVTLASGTTNSLSGGLSSTATIDAALYSAEDLTINGDGSLTITSNGVGIRSKDGLKINGGVINVTAAADGIKGKDFVYAAAGTVSVTSAGDGIYAYYGSDTDDTADSTRGYVLIEGGTFTVKSGGGSSVTPGSSSAKAIKAVSSIDISSGTFTLNSADDAIHSGAGGSISGGTFTITANATSGQGIKFGDSSSFTISGTPTITVNSSFEGIAGYKLAISGSPTISVTASNDGFSISAGTVSGGAETNDGSLLTISGGTVYVCNSSGDAVDSNGSIAMSGGTLIVNGATSSPEEGLDYNGNLTVTGGTIIAAAVTNTLSNASATTQATVMVNIGSSQAAGTLFHVQDASGADIITFKPKYSYASVVFSSPSLKTGTSYSFYYGGSTTGTANGYGVYSGGTYTAGTLYKTSSLSSTVSTIGTSSTGGGAAPTHP
jgi:hypothetical protein